MLPTWRPVAPRGSIKGEGPPGSVHFQHSPPSAATGNSRRRECGPAMGFRDLNRPNSGYPHPFSFCQPSVFVTFLCSESDGRGCGGAKAPAWAPTSRDCTGAPERK